MFTVLQRSKTLVRRCARDFLYANILQLPRRQQILAGNSFQERHYSSSAPIPGENRVWTDDEISKVVEHVKSEYYSRKHKPDWKKVSERFGIPPGTCYDMYYSPNKINLKENDAEATEKDGKEPKFKVKAVLDGAKKRRALRIEWTADEIARLREARGDRNKKCHGRWAKIAEYVGNGKTTMHCYNKWNTLCLADDRKAWQYNQNSSTAANGATNTKANYLSGWTPDEILQLKMLLDKPPDQLNPRLHIAYALFPQKPQAQVRYTMHRLNDAMAKQRLNMLESESRPLLRKLVNDSGGGEKADWEAIGKEIGLTAYRCQKIYREMSVLKFRYIPWTPDEYDRLLTNLRSQHARGGVYDWNLAAAAVGTRTNGQCCARFCYDKKTNKRHLYDFDSLQK